MLCPNKNSQEWKTLVSSRGEDLAYFLWNKYEGNVPESESGASIVKAGLKSVDILNSQKAVDMFSKGEKNNWPLFKTLSELQIPKEQKQLILDSGLTNREEIITDLLANYSFAIEINIAKESMSDNKLQELSKNKEFQFNNYKYFSDNEGYWRFDNSVDSLNKRNLEKIDLSDYTKAYRSSIENSPTQVYSNLTVPGGTNYTENELATPAIKPAIKGHAQFATNQGIGWFRSDEQVLNSKEVININSIEERIEQLEGTFKPKVDLSNAIFTKTRRILELQSDLFQKGRDKAFLTFGNNDTLDTEYVKENFDTINKSNNFLQLLNKDNNWVTFFVKSIIQDSAKKGYEKVLFPTGSTAYKIESGGNTIEDFIKNKEDRIKKLEDSLKTEPKPENGKYVLYTTDDETGQDVSEKFDTLKEAEEYQRRNSGWLFANEEIGFRGRGENISEIEQLKKEIKDAKEGTSGLAATAKFYETAITNILNKQYGKENVKQITDEHGNTWNEIQIEQIRDNSTILFQSKEMPMSVASKEQVEQMKQLAEKIGISIQSLSDYLKGNPEVDAKGTNALADLMKKAIAISEGKEDVAITEELVHVISSMVEQINPKLITELISKIERFKIYKITLEAYKNNKAYQLPNGKPDIRKIKREAVDKLISELIINNGQNEEQFPEYRERETLSLVQRMWNALLDLLRGVYRKSDIDIFKEAKDVILTEDFSNVETASKEIFFQLGNNPALDKMYNTLEEIDSRMELVPALGENKRHYTFDGEKVAKSVTEKLKEQSASKFKGTRTEEQQKFDDQKREWGSEGHRFIEKYIGANWLDENGFVRSQKLDQNISTTLDDSLSEVVTTFADDLMSSYPQGTRVLLEKKNVNEREKGKLASTLDFVALIPDGDSFKMDILDWKFTSFDTSREEDIPFYKKDEWIPQMGEYVKMAYNRGVDKKQLRYTRMIPFVLEYKNSINGDKTSPLVPYSIEVGNIDPKKETNLYLLPVPANTELTGNPKVDRLISSLREYWSKLYKTPVAPEEKFSKRLRMNQLSKAIRSLHLQLNFEPLYNVSKTFLENIKSTIDSFENFNIENMSQEELGAKLKILLEYQQSAEKFVSLDETYLSNIENEEVTPEERKLLDNFSRISRKTKTALKQIVEIQKEYAFQLALKEGFITEEDRETFLSAEKEIAAIDKTFLESSKLSSSVVSFATRMIKVARSETAIRFREIAKAYSEALVPLEQEARAAGKSAFEMIATMTENGPRLIKKLDSAFLEKIKKAKEEHKKDFLLANLDVIKYNELVKPVIERGLEELDRTMFSENEEEDFAKREALKKQLRNSLDITLDSFNGYEDYTFGYYYRKAMIEEGNYSKEYMEMAKSENALKVWNFFTELNERAKESGYLEKQGMSFFPMIEATSLQKFYQTNNLSGEIKDFFSDFYSLKPDEEIGFSKTDEETGKLKKIIPRYFLRHRGEVNKLSKDLNRVGLMWAKAIMEYETSKQLENTLLTLHSVESQKGSFMTNEKGQIIFDGSDPRVNEAENKNAQVLQTIIDDDIYGIKENLNSLGNTLTATAASKLSKTDEAAESRAISAKKLIKNGDTLTRALALGLKPLIGTANYLGTQMQGYIQSGNLYSYSEFLKNNRDVLIPGKLSLIQKALIDKIVPISGTEQITEEIRKGAKNISYVNYLNSWTFSDVMMVTNSAPERRIEFATALSIIENSMIVDGKIVNIRQHLKEIDRKDRKNLSYAERREREKNFDKRVKELKQTSSLLNVAKIENDKLEIPGVSERELAKFRVSIIEATRNLTGQMSNVDKMGYRRDTIFSSFMMFKGWIPKQLSVRYIDIRKNSDFNQWEYGRFRSFGKTLAEIGIFNVKGLRDIYLGTDKGLEMINDILKAKKEEYYKRTGKELTITEEEFQDLLRQNIKEMYKEIRLILGIIALLTAAKIAEPPEDEDPVLKNKYKYFLKGVNKVSDEVLFYVNPASADEMTRGSIIPSLGLLTRVIKIFEALSKEGYYYYTEDEKGLEKTHPTKYMINLIPVGSQVQNEVLPLVDPELAKEMGIRMSAESRIKS